MTPFEKWQKKKAIQGISPRQNGRLAAQDGLPNTEGFAVPPGRAIQGVSGLARQQAGFEVPRDCQRILEEDVR